MNMLLLLMFPLPNVHYSSALIIHFSFSETPTLLLAQRRIIYIFNRIVQLPLCSSSILSVLLIQLIAAFPTSILPSVYNHCHTKTKVPYDIFLPLQCRFVIDIRF